MEFTFTADQMAFRDSVSRFLMTEAPPEMLREVWDTDAGRSPELRRKIASRLRGKAKIARFVKRIARPIN